MIQDPLNGIGPAHSFQGGNHRFMKMLRSHIVSRFVLGSCLLTASGALATASPSTGSYYNVTDLGANAGLAYYKYESSVSGVVKDSQGNSYPFPRSTTAASLSNQDLASLPGEAVKQNEPPYNSEYMRMGPILVNSKGTILGTLPHGGNGIGYVVGYTQRNAEGTGFEPFHPIDYVIPGNWRDMLDLNAKDQALIMGTLYYLGDPVKLVYSTKDLIPPWLRDKYDIIFAEALDDNGDMLAESFTPQEGRIMLLLTPPDQTDPSPIPEPSTFLGWGLAGGALWLGSVCRRRSRSSA